METARISQGEFIKIRFKRHSDVADLLNQLHDYYELSWPKIADLPSINPPDQDQIPISTLAAIAHNKIVPKKWRSRFGVGAIDNRQRISISKTRMESAAKSIKRNIDPALVIKLKELL